MRARGLVLVAAAVVATTLAACGGGASALTKAELVKQGDVICKRANDKLNKSGLEIFVLRPTAKELSVFLGEAIPIFNGALADLDKLKPPKPDQTAVDAMIAAGRSDLGKIEAIRTRAASGDEKAGDALFKLQSATPNFDAKAKSYGFKECGKSLLGSLAPTTSGAPTAAQRAAFPPEKQAFIKQADAICATEKKAEDEAFNSVFAQGPPTLDAWKTALPKVIALSEKEQSAFAALTPPAADKAAFDATLAKERELLDKARVALAAAVAGDRDGFRKAFSETDALSKAADKSAREFGFEVCGKSLLGE